MDDRLASVSLRRLHAFLAVCDTLHMARAADRLHITQPALSQQIQGLEQALGVMLFNRRKRGIDLTAAGEACRAEAEKLLAAHALMIDGVLRTARGEAGQLNIGYVGSLMYGQRFPLQLKTMQQQFPDVELSLRQGTFSGLLSAVRAGELDVALVGAPAEIEAPLAHRMHSRQDLVAALPQDHPLAQFESVPLSRLSGEPLIALRGTDDIGASRVVARTAAAAGLDLDIKWHVSEFNGVLGLVAAGFGCAIVPEDLARISTREIHFRPVTPPGLYTEYWLVWNRQRTTPALDQFMNLVAL